LSEAYLTGAVPQLPQWLADIIRARPTKVAPTPPPAPQSTPGYSRCSRSPRRSSRSPLVCCSKDTCLATGASLRAMGASYSSASAIPIPQSPSMIHAPAFICGAPRGEWRAVRATSRSGRH
jgi:hypothetical protein